MSKAGLRLLGPHHSTPCLVRFPACLWIFCSNLLWEMMVRFHTHSRLRKSGKLTFRTGSGGSGDWTWRKVKKGQRKAANQWGVVYTVVKTPRLMKLELWLFGMLCHIPHHLHSGLCLSDMERQLPIWGCNLCEVPFICLTTAPSYGSGGNYRDPRSLACPFCLLMISNTVLPTKTLWFVLNTKQ